MQSLVRRRTVLVLFVAIASAGVLISGFEHRKRQTAGICDATGQRLSDTQVLQRARSYAISLAAAHGAGALPDNAITLRIVPDGALRDEDQVPTWVRTAGGFRAYIEIAYDESRLSGADMQNLPRLNLMVVSNCGTIRNAVYEFDRHWFW